MSRIDLTTKFFHGIGWDEKYDVSRIKMLNEILQGGQILSSKDLAIKNGSNFSAKSNQIFLSVYPYGIYASAFCGDGYNKGYTGYDMTLDSFYFILSESLFNDFNVEPGAFPLECMVCKPIDLKRYLVGVGNAGYNIDSNLLMGYYYTLYLKGILSRETMLNRIRNCLNPGAEYIQFQDNQVIWEIIDYWANLGLGDSQYSRFLETAQEKSPEEFVDPGYYSVLRKVFAENGFFTEFYDYEGYSIEPDKQLARVRRMQQYILKNAPYKK